MKKNALILIPLLAGFVCIAQNNSVPEKVKQRFKQMYPEINDTLIWKLNGNNFYAADFKNEGRETRIVLRDDGFPVLTKTKIELRELPVYITEDLKTTYADYPVLETYTVFMNGIIYYVPIINAEEYVEGSLLKIKKSDAKEKKTAIRVYNNGSQKGSFSAVLYDAFAPL